MSATWKVHLTLPRAQAEQVCEALSDWIEPASTAVSLDEATPPTHWHVDAYYNHQPDPAQINASLAPLFDALGETPVPVKIEALPDIDWIAKSLEGLKPIHAGRFFVHGAHDRDKIPVNTIPILVDAGQAFGTGHHPTTLGCLLYIDEICTRRPVKNPLDLGCGTGLLAIALAKRIHRPVQASDIDPLAVKVARENARANGVQAFVRPVTATGFGHPALSAQAPFDLIVANILARPLAALAPAMSRHLAPGGELVLSGILRHQERTVTATTRARGLRLVGRKPIKEWVTLHLQS